jgi:hypothetical protein
MPTKNYRVTASAIGSYYYANITAESEEEALSIASTLSDHDWDFEIGEPTMDSDDFVAEEVKR